MSQPEETNKDIERAQRLEWLVKRLTTQPEDYTFKPTADFDTAASHMHEHLMQVLAGHFWGRMARRFIPFHVIRGACYELYNIARRYAVPLQKDDREIFRAMLNDHTSMTLLEGIVGNVQVYKLPNGYIRIFGKGNVVLLGEGVNMREALADYEVRRSAPLPIQEMALCSNGADAVD